MSAIEIASLFAVLEADDRLSGQLDSADQKVLGLGDRINRVGSSMVVAGGKITAMTEPIREGLASAIGAATDFSESMTNVQAVLGKTDGEMQALNAEVLALGINSRAGPQAAAEAFYDIVGGVSDASAHMDILSASIATAEAGSADLGATTNALIAVMNSYKFSADEASYASDVLTRTVGMGVGTMDEFASALPQVTGLANSLGISFGDLGAMAAYLTTQGNSASQATTQLSAMMTAMLNPNETMKKGLKELGFETGEAAIKQLGLVGAYQALGDTQVAASDGLAKMTGSVEALRGVTSFAGDDVQGFFDTFTGGIEGATAAAQAIQLDSAAAQFDLLKSQMAGLSIEVGTVLIPILMDLVEQVKPVITEIMNWVEQNPQATQTIVALTGAVVVLGPLIMGLGMTISAIGTIITGVTAIVGVFGTGLGALSGFAGVAGAGIAALMSPILAVTAAAVAAVAALKAVIDFHNQVSAAAGQAQQQVAALQADGANITRQQLDDQAFKSVAGQFGGGVLGDVAARLTYSNFADATQGNTVMESGRVANNGRGNLGLPGRDSGGDGVAGQTYLIGTGAQPELFTAPANGTFIPNANKAMGGNQIGQLIIYANDAAGGRAAADGYSQRMEELDRARG